MADEYGLACPDCGGDDALQIVTKAPAHISADGAAPEGEHEWDQTSPCRCTHCDELGTVADFTICIGQLGSG